MAKTPRRESLRTNRLAHLEVCWARLVVHPHRMGIESPVTEVHQSRRACQSKEPGAGGHDPATVGLRLEDSRTSAYCLAMPAHGVAMGKKSPSGKMDKLKPPALPCWASVGILQVQVPVDDH